MAAVILGIDRKAFGYECACQAVVSERMFSHSVRYLNQGSRGAFRPCAPGRQFGAVIGGDREALKFRTH